MMRSSEIKDIDDLLIEIFLRLPVYSIQLLLLVCKKWQSLLTDPLFRKEWRKRNIKPSTGLFRQTTRESTSYSLVTFSPNDPIKLRPLYFEIEGFCNGLLLCSTSKTRYHVYNPTNDTCHTLPELDEGVIVPGSTKVRSIRLGFEPNRRPSYKVVCLVGKDDLISSSALDIYVYSPETGVWKSVGTTPFTLQPYYYEGVYWNGCIHFMSLCKRFDIENETIDIIPYPRYSDFFIKDYYLGVSCDRLIYAKFWRKNWDMRTISVCELKGHYSEWVLKYRVELESLPFAAYSLFSVVLGVEKEDSFLVLKTNQGIVRYNLESETFEEIPSSPNGGVICGEYIESQYCV